MAEKVKFTFVPDGADIPSQFGIDATRAENLAREAKDRFLDTLSDGDGRLDIGIALQDALRDCETIEEVIFQTYVLVKIMEAIEHNPLGKMMAALHFAKKKMK